MKHTLIIAAGLIILVPMWVCFFYAYRWAGRRKWQNFMSAVIAQNSMFGAAVWISLVICIYLRI